MNLDLTLDISVDINASPARVWEVMTNPELIKIYLHGTECITDWKVGNPVVFQGEYDGHIYKDHGIVKVNEEESQLSYSYWTSFSGLPDAPENHCLVSYRIDPISEGLTKLTWDQKGYVDEAAMKRAEEHMPAFVDHIKKVAEEQ